jgi:hypothetical protein
MAFTGFLVRDNQADNGSTPTNGAVYTSPDVIPYQSSILTDSLAVSTYPGNPGLAVQNGAINNIYVRAVNKSATSQQGSAQLYYASSTLVALPSQWTKNQVLTAGGSTSAPFADATTPALGGNVGGGDIAITTPPFLLTSLQAPPPGSHYCFVAIATPSGQTPFIPTSFASNSAFVDWIESNPNVAWRNFVFAPPNSPTIVTNCVFANSNKTSAEFVFTIEATNCPTNTAILLQCTTTTPPINVTIQLPAPGSDGKQITSTTQSVPANFTGTMLIQATAPAGTQFGTNYTFDPTCFQVVDSDTDDVLEIKLRKKRTYRTTHADGRVVTAARFLMRLGQVNVRPGSAS